MHIIARDVASHSDYYAIDIIFISTYIIQFSEPLNLAAYTLIIRETSYITN